MSQLIGDANDSATAAVSQAASGSVHDIVHEDSNGNGRSEGAEVCHEGGAGDGVSVISLKTDEAHRIFNGSQTMLIRSWTMEAGLLHILVPQLGNTLLGTAAPMDLIKLRISCGSFYGLWAGEIHLISRPLRVSELRPFDEK